MFQNYENRKAWCIIRWLVIGVVAGVFSSSVLCFLQPKLFESVSVVKVDETPGRSVDLSIMRAAQALRLTAYLSTRSLDDPDEILKLCKNTKIISRDGEVEIRVRSLNSFEARDIALELAWLFRGMEEEERHATVLLDLPLSDEDYVDAMERRMAVERLMNEACREAELGLQFRQVPFLVIQGNAKAKAIWNSESFQRQWNYHSEVTWEIAGGVKSDLPILSLVEYPIISDIPVSPNVMFYQQCGFLVGLAFGGLIGVKRSLRLKKSDGSVGSGDVNLPSYAETDPPDPTVFADSKSRPSSPEDEW